MGYFNQGDFVRSISTGEIGKVSHIDPVIDDLRYNDPNKKGQITKTIYHIELYSAGNRTGEVEKFNDNDLVKIDIYTI